jgi:hypothetical protein
MPRVELNDSVTSLVTGSNKPIRIKTPLSRRAHLGTLEPHWKHSAWADGAIPKLKALMESYERQNSDGADPPLL